MQQTNDQLAQKAQQLAEQNAEVERKNQQIEQARGALEEKAAELALTSKYKSEFLAKMAHDGLEAVEAAAKLLPQVVLLDIGMPNLNGYDAARQIRQQAWGKDMVLIALTGWGQEQDRERTREAGFDAHLLKPVDHDVLMKLLASTPARTWQMGA